MPQRQLNIRSDEAAARAATLARHLRKTTTEVVVEALRSYEQKVGSPDGSGLTIDQLSDRDALLDLARRAREHAAPDASWDHDWLYDEHGLPK